jgi:uncharacterized membrane protein (UPF0127 family)
LRFTRTVLYALAAGAAGSCIGTVANAQDCGLLPSLHRLKAETMTIVSAKGPVKLKTEVALSPVEQERGLMCRKTVPGDHAMLFVFKPAEPVTFWMKNTLVPLDMLFVGADGHIFNIVRKAPRLSLEPIPSNGAAVGVIEIGGGRADALGIQPGDKVETQSLPHD